jgi:hypothetical protein
MVVSALLNYAYVLSSDHDVSRLKMDVQNNQALIRDVWNSVLRREAKVDVVVLLKLLQTVNKPETAEIINHYLKEYSEIPNKGNAVQILLASDKSKANDLDYIDSLYLEQVKNQVVIDRIESEKKIYVSIAFFMQIFSLLLIIVRRDMFG